MEKSRLENGLHHCSATRARSVFSSAQQSDGDYRRSSVSCFRPNIPDGIFQERETMTCYWQLFFFSVISVSMTPFLHFDLTQHMSHPCLKSIAWKTSSIYLAVCLYYDYYYNCSCSTVKLFISIDLCFSSLTSKAVIVSNMQWSPYSSLRCSFWASKIRTTGEIFSAYIAPVLAIIDQCRISGDAWHGEISQNTSDAEQTCWQNDDVLFDWTSVSELTKSPSMRSRRKCEMTCLWSAVSVQTWC